MTRALLAVGLSGLAGCTGHLPWGTIPGSGPERVPVVVPASFSAGTEGRPPADRWWQELGDPGLGELVERALSDNLGLKQAWARLEQANAILARSAAGRLPEVTGEGQASRQRSVFFAGEELGERQFVSAQLVGAFAANWELDLWRRIGSLADAAEMDREAARGDLEAVAISLAGEIAESWFSLAEQRAQLALLEEQTKVSDQIGRLVDLRFSQGLGTAPDVLQQRQQIASVRALVPPVRAGIAVLEHRLGVLVGWPPNLGAFPVRPGVPELPPIPATGLPADLLRGRPDVRAAERRVAAADYRIAAAIADRFPAIRLSGRTGWQGFEAAELPNNWIWTIASNVVTPLFDAGRRRAEVDRSRAELDERLAAYGETVLGALEEVENALVQERHQRAHIEALERQVELARQTLGEIRNRYAFGLGDYVQVLTALQSLQQAERAELSARKQLVSIRVQLYRALGGSWTGALAPPPGATVRPASPLLRWVSFQ
ncbi:MAG: efflux transporter outer membrane subunit [Candidatus Binatia bacterium]